MRLSQLFGKTLRQAPAEAETPSHQLLLRTGMVAQVAAGVYAYLPLGHRVLRKIEGIIREEMDAEGGQEMLMPSLLPIELYEASGRDKTMGDILFRLKDNRGREFALGPTHEELFAEVFKRNVQSYRDLPLLVYQIASKFRDEPRPRGGLIRLRQFIMKDLYSFDESWEGLDVSYKKMYDAYQRIFDRCGVPTVPVLADAGMMGGRETHQFTYLTEIGEDTCLLCPSCGYAADSEVAAFVKEPLHGDEAPAATEEIDTPGLYTIEALAKFLGVPESKTAKAVFYWGTLNTKAQRDEGGEASRAEARPTDGPGLEPPWASHPLEAGERGNTKARRDEGGEASRAEARPTDGGVQRVAVFVVIRGDMDVNEAKLRKAVGATELVYMEADEVKGAGFVAGSAGAVGLRERLETGNSKVGHGLLIVADDVVTKERNLVAGANEADKHVLNTNYGRDWTADVVADIALAGPGSKCANCGSAMDARRGIEMGQVFKLGDGYGEKLGAYFLDAEGKQRPPIMGSYGIGVERLLAAVIEEHHDENGITWPANLAPFDVHIVAIQPDKAGVRETAERLYGELKASGVEALLDDRDESPGVKFKDADLLGMPLRVTVSPRNLENAQLEVKRRTEGESELIAVEGASGVIVKAVGDTR